MESAYKEVVGATELISYMGIHSMVILDKKQSVPEIDFAIGENSL